MGRASRRPQGIGSGYEHQKGRVPVLGTPLFMNPDPLKTLDLISPLLPRNKSLFNLHGT